MKSENWFLNEHKFNSNSSLQWGGQCAFYAQCATVRSVNTFSLYESVVSLLLPCLFVCLRRGCFPRLSWELKSSKLWSTMWAEELHVRATWLGVLKSSPHPPPGIGWNKSPLSFDWLWPLCVNHYYNDYLFFYFFGDISVFYYTGCVTNRLYATVL